MTAMKMNRKTIPINSTMSFSDPRSTPTPFVVPVRHTQTKENIKGDKKPTKANQHAMKKDFK